MNPFLEAVLVGVAVVVVSAIGILAVLWFGSWWGQD